MRAAALLLLLSTVSSAEDAPDAGMPPSPPPETFAGRWELDVDATIARLAPAVAGEAKTKLRAELVTIGADNAFVFDVNGTFESTSGAGVTRRVIKGTWRADGEAIYLREPPKKAERRFDYRIADDTLLLGHLPALSTYRKKP